MLKIARNRWNDGDNYLRITSLKYLPRWVIFCIDITLTIVGILVTYLTLTLAGMQLPGVLSFPAKLIIITGVHIIFMYIFKTYAGVIRHTAFIDLQKLFFAAFASVVTLLLLNAAFSVFTAQRLFLNSVLIFNFVANVALLLLFRIVVKQMFHYMKEIKRSSEKERILMVGISDVPIATALAIIENPGLPFEIAGFVTKRTGAAYAKILGKPIFEKEYIVKKTREELDIDGVLIIHELLGKDELEEWVNLFLEKGLKIFKAPTVEKIREDSGNTSIKNLRIEDLLDRKPIKIENREVKIRHEDKNVLVTGGAGSIGREILIQVAAHSPALIVVVDQAETPLHELQLEMQELFPTQNFRFILADVSNRRRMEQIFREFSFSMVYHAAAYKHVPLIEDNPHEGVRVNIWGTRNVAELASRYGINRFVMISTDKAVNPTNVMGATKRAAELFVQALQAQPENRTKFITTRFGNVLGSNGSVIPHFKRQIEKGGPITITHPDITRYFMTIPEACDLVLQAGTMGQGGEIYVFDMGEPVKIIDLARRMIKLNGMKEGEDIKIVVTGLRPGEKLYEELLSDDAKTLPTHHEKIMISKDPRVEFDTISATVNEISVAAMKRDKEAVVALLKHIVPEFKSNNSVFQMLDK